MREREKKRKNICVHEQICKKPLTDIRRSK